MARTIKINGEALKNELKKRGCKLSETSQEIGYSDAYLNYAINVGAISAPATKALAILYNIAPETYTKAPEQPEEKSEPEFDKLYAVIREAVFNAIMDVKREVESDD